MAYRALLAAFGLSMTVLGACGGGGSSPGVTVQSVTVSPTAVSVTVGATDQFHAAATYSDGHSSDVSNTATWSSDTPAVATVNSSGLVTGVAVGTAVISARLGTTAGAWTITVATNLQSVVVTATSASITKNTTEQFKAFANYVDGHSADVTNSVVWTSDTPSVATASSSGLVTGVAVGAATISARLGTTAGALAIAIIAPVVASISVAPSTASMTTGGPTQQLTAAGTLTDGSIADITTSATWSVDRYDCASVTAHGGLVTAVLGIGNNCPAVVTATLSNVSGTARVTINGLFAPVSHVPQLSVYEPNGVTIGDFNGDGRPDLAITSLHGGVVISLGIGGGAFGPQTTIPLGGYTASPIAGDFNGDGKVDLILLSSTLVLLPGDGTGGFGTPQNFALDPNARWLAAADFNGDGKPDLAVANSTSNTVTILLGETPGPFGLERPLFAPIAPTFVTVGDINGDGKPDLVLADSASGNVSVMLGTGTGGFGGAITFVAGGHPSSVAIGDFNGDGKPDLAVTTGANSVSIFLGDGTGSFTPGGTFAVSSAASFVAVADFNGDGKPDLAITNNSGIAGGVSILLGTGAGSFGPEIMLPINCGPCGLNFIAVADLNGDGKPDIVVSDMGSVGTVSILLHQ